MATRRETAKRKDQLRRDLRDSRGGVGWRAGELAQSQRALAEKYGLSQFTVRQEIKKLSAEGVLHSVARVGTFAGTPSVQQSKFYLLVTRDGTLGELRFQQTQSGFEEAIARRGDAVLTLEKSDAIARCQRGELPPFAGMFDLAYWPGDADWTLQGQSITARVSAAKRFETRPGYDLTSFDDIEGGRIAAQHLLNRGHTQIAFLALHSVERESSLVDWSAEREAGWREGLQQAQIESDGLLFQPRRDAFGLATHPLQNAKNAAIRQDFAEMLQQLIARLDITAVVAANDFAALELLAALRAARRPQAQWPAIVGFDNHPLAQGQLLTSLQLPSEELGRTAGKLLWERHNGHLDKTPQQRLVQMRLIPRLTCQPAQMQRTEYDALLPSTDAPRASKISTGDLAIT